MPEAIALDRIRTDGGTQPRATLHQDWIEDYATDMVAGAEFPPVVVFYDGSDYWLADGFHRVGAAAGLGLVDIEADVRQGTCRDAILFSVGANGAHGQRRTNEDKRRAVLCLLNDPEWSVWADREVARRCGVDNSFVSRLRPSVVRPQIPAAAPREPETRQVARGGKTYPMNVGPIGRKPVPLAPAAEKPAAEPSEKMSSGDTLSDPRTQLAVPKFDHEAASIRNAAMNAIVALAEQPAPEVVLAAWMKNWGYGEPVEKIEAAIRWLTDFLPLYREAEPRRWAAVEAAVARTKDHAHAAE